jgi:hypothetical protein
MTADSGEFHPGKFRRSLRRAGITSTEYRVAVELSEYANPGNPIVWPSVETLAADCEVTDRTIERTLSALKSKRLIAEVGSRKGGRGRTTRWLLVNPDTGDTLSGSETPPLVTETPTLVTLNPDTSVTRSSKEVVHEVAKEPPTPVVLEVLPVPHTDGAGKAIAKFDQLNRTARSPEAGRIAESFSGWLPQPIERGELAKVGAAIDKCLKSNISPNAIAEGLKLWHASDSWSPTQIPAFVNKANSRPKATNGKPTEKALGWEAAGAELIAEMRQRKAIGGGDE